MSLLPLYKSPGTCDISFTPTKPGTLPGHKGSSGETEVLATGAWLWIRPLSSDAQDARFARLRLVVTHQVNVDAAIPMRIGAVITYAGKSYAVRSLVPPAAGPFFPDQGWICDVEEVA